MNPKNPKNHSLARRLTPAVALTGASVFGIFVLDRAAGSGDTNTFAGGPDDSSVRVDSSVPATVATTTPPTFAPQDPPSRDGWDEGDDDRGFGPNGDEGGINPQGAGGQGSGGLTDTTVAPTPGCTGTTTSGSAEPISDWRRTFGTLTVSITKDASGTICDVSAIYNVRDRRSLRIEQYAIPRLNAWAKESNGTSVHAISGATAVCDAYVASLQAALDASNGR